MDTSSPPVKFAEKTTFEDTRHDGMIVEVALAEPATRWWRYYYNKYKTIKLDGLVQSRELLEKVCFVVPQGERYSSEQVEMYPIAPHLLSRGESEEISLEQVDLSGDPMPGHRISASDAAGPSYRKIALHGLPLSDSKPQSKDESGELSEETYVDAFTRQINHVVSDVYSSVDSSLLPIVVRRSAREQAWSLRQGLRPKELPDAPFGPGWSSNLCANIRFEDSFRKAIVTDEQGASVIFYRSIPVLPEDPNQPHVWIHSREEKQNARTAFDSLETIRDAGNAVVGFKYTKKYGAVCTYQITPIYQLHTSDRVDGSFKYVELRYARLTHVGDRWSNQLVYTYPSDTTLIPNKIHDPARANQLVTITQADGVVTAVRGPSGETVSYSYSLQGTGDDQVRSLTTVQRGGSQVNYQYETVTEAAPAADLDPNGPLEPDHRHFNLTRIEDERGADYDFTYEFNHGNKYYETSGPAFRLRCQLGLPRLVKKVTLPDASVVNFGGTRSIQAQSDATISSGSVQTVVSGPGGTYTYTFTQPDVFVPLRNDPGKEDDPFSKQLTVFFSRMEIDTPEGDEIYNFDFDHGMALTSATDLSGNTTTFHYGTVGANGLGWDDPIQQVNALGKSRYFTYDNDTRVMKSMTDERGTLTSYTIQSGTGLRTKETISKGGTTLRVTDFDYGAGGFAGFLAKTTVQSTTATGGDLVTEYTPDANGRVQKEAVTAGGGIELVTSYTYTGNGSKKTVTNPRGHTTTFTYDAQSLRLAGVENPDSTTRTLGYDAHGNLTSEVNERGVTTTHEYDSLNRRKKTTVDMDDGADLVSETTYTALNLPHTETNPRGTVTTHTYDGIGRRLTTTVGSGGDAQTTTFTYGANSGGSVFDVSGFKPTTITDPRGKVTTITYDDLYRPTVKQAPEGNTVTTTYDDVGNPEEVKDALNRITKTTFDGLNRPTKVEYPDATTRHSSYTPSGLVWKVVDELGRETLTQYDRAGRALEVTLPEVNGVSPVTKTAYDANGNVIAAQDPLGNIVTTVYDNRNRPTKVTSPYVWDALEGQWSRPEVNTTYDAGGNVLTVTDPLGKVTTKTYNNAGWGLTVTNALGQVTSSTYDRNGNVKTVTDALNRVVTNTYDIHNRLIETEDAEEQITTFGYDKNGNRTSVTDPRGKVTTFTYDDLNRLLKETFQEGVWTERHYDAVRETSREDSAGREFTFGYDLRDRLTTTTWTVGGSPVVRTRVYDTAGRLTDVTETGRPEATVGYTYDALDRVATETSQGLTHTYTYDLGGRRTGSALGTGKTIATTYDSQGKPLTVTEGGRTTVYHYDLASRAVAQTQPNGLWQYNAYDNLGRLESRQTYTSADALQAQFLWTYDAVGNVTVQSERWPGEGTRGAGWRSTVMVYDATNRLTGEAMAQPGSPVITTGYAYDTGSNRSVKLVSTDGTLTTKTLYTYNDFNQLTDWSEEDGLGAVTRTADLTYDLAGNRATQTLTVTGQSAQTTTYHWDAENRLEGVTLPNADEHEYGYDYRTRRISRVENGIGTAIVYSGGLSVAEYESPGITPTVEYLRGPDMGGGVGGMMYSLRNGGTEAKYAMSNGRGDVVAQSNDAGALTWTAS
ncbi:sugar-binding protein, partial [Verrucomicrobium sp. BvORR034]|uniref:sugar-binding protein n=1 Tax=Verrucomicrobium sp. BvORR034 TaxID=1396418 RepID=UPI002240F970